MSYDINLVDKDTLEPVYTEQPHNIRGGTYALESTEAYLNITFNYYEHYKKYGLYIPDLDQCLVSDVIQKLFDVYNKMQGEPSDNYWEPSEGNAKAALQKLIQLCSLAPNSRIKVAY